MLFTSGGRSGNTSVRYFGNHLSMSQEKHNSWVEDCGFISSRKRDIAYCALLLLNTGETCNAILAACLLCAWWHVKMAPWYSFYSINNKNSFQDQNLIISSILKHSILAKLVAKKMSRNVAFAFAFLDILSTIASLPLNKSIHNYFKLQNRC